MPRRPNILGETRCTDCKEIIMEDNASYARGSIKGICKYCYNQRMLKWKEAHPESHLKKVMKGYGITVEEFNYKTELQLNGCAICKQPCKVHERLSVDHDHKINQIRDLLCARCNMVLGAVNDDDSLLFAMIEYLKRHGLKYAV